MNVLFHVEQYDVLGVLPSQLEALALVCESAKVGRRAFIDGTVDGVRRGFGFDRYTGLDDFFVQNGTIHWSSIYFFTPRRGPDIRTLSNLPDDAWIIFGPAMGWGVIPATWECVHLPGFDLSGRDCIPIALWQLGKWPEP